MTAPGWRLFESLKTRKTGDLPKTEGVPEGGGGSEGASLSQSRGLRFGACPCCVPSVVRRSLGGHALPGTQDGRIHGPVPPLPGSGFRLSVLLCRESALTACSAQAEPGTVPGGQVLGRVPGTHRRASLCSAPRRTPRIQAWPGPVFHRRATVPPRNPSEFAARGGFAFWRSKYYLLILRACMAGIFPAARTTASARSTNPGNACMRASRTRPVRVAPVTPETTSKSSRTS